jgi:DNA-binding FrmR family transcriptional regulator
MINSMTAMEIKNMIEDKDTGRLDIFIQSVTSSLNKIEKVLLIGNGTPSLVERMTRNEENIERLIELVDKNSQLSTSHIEELKKDITTNLLEMKLAVQTHCGDANSHTPKGLLLRKDVIFYVVGGFLILHALLPANLNVWELVMKIFGV